MESGPAKSSSLSNTRADQRAALPRKKEEKHLIWKRTGGGDEMAEEENYIL